MEEYCKSADLIDTGIRSFFNHLVQPNTPLEVFTLLKSIQNSIHPNMDEQRVWELVYSLATMDAKIMAKHKRYHGPFARFSDLNINIHEKNKAWVVIYLKELSTQKSIL